jgi:ubiquinone/menaquinone biosynthesis C-methylase UbiE
MKDYLKIYLKNRPLFLGIIRAKEVEIFQEYLPFKKPIIDFGCGDGFFAKVAFSGQGKIDVGVDINKKTLKEAKNEKIYKKLVFYNQKRLPFKNATFSTAVSNCVLEHVDNLDLDLKEINRVLKDKGRFYLTVMTDKWEEYLFGSIFLGNIYTKWMRNQQVHKQLFSKEKWIQEFRKAGFSVKKSTGYLDKKTSMWLDLLHYLSIDSLLTYKLFKKWVIFPQRYDIFPVYKLLFNLTKKDIDPDESAALYFELIKN